MVELWIVFSLLTAIVWAFVNMLDKFFLSKWTRNPSVPLLILGFVDLSAAIII
jgi:hypothetical protein